MKTFKLLHIFIIAFVFNSSAQVEPRLSQDKWNDDIDFLVKNISAIVPNFKSKVNQTKFSNRVEELKRDISSKSIDDIIWEMQNLLNFIEDDGCNIMPFQKALNPKISPIKSYWFSDGLYICDASDSYGSLKGEQIIKINSVEISELFNDLSTSLNGDNEHYKKNLFPLYAIYPSLLKSQGVGNFNDAIELEFASGKTVTVMAEDVSEYRKLKRELPNDEVFYLTNSNHKNDYYWFEYLPNSKTLFVQLQWIYNNKEDISFSEFVKNIEDEIEKGNANKIILDLRYGGGGNGFKFKGFTDLLRDSETINKKGNLFVLTSRETRGAILELTSVLELNTKAILVGEPTGEGPNTVGDTKQISLPNSGISVSLTKVFWPTSWDADKRKTIEPDVSVIYTYRQHQTKQDPWIDAVVAFTVNSYSNTFPKELLESLVGTYKINDRKITVEEEKGKLFLSMKRPIKSFFEIRTELHYKSEGILFTDISDVTVNYKPIKKGDIEITSINWKGVLLKTEN